MVGRVVGVALDDVDAQVATGDLLRALPGAVGHEEHEALLLGVAVVDAVALDHIAGTRVVQQGVLGTAAAVERELARRQRAIRSCYVKHHAASSSRKTELRVERITRAGSKVAWSIAVVVSLAHALVANAN